MIEYKFPEEKDIVLHYAKLLKDKDAEQILMKEFVENKGEALKLKDFYWSMVDQSVIDQGDGMDVLKKEGIESWMEYIFHSFNAYFVSNGYEKEWDTE